MDTFIERQGFYDYINHFVAVSYTHLRAHET